jgi:serine/threonine protein kinase
MTVIGEGTYGCVHKPSLKCKDRPDMSYEGKLSKIMTKEHVIIEMDEYKTIDTVDKDGKFYLGKPEECEPIIDTETITEVDACQWIKSDDLENMKLLIMQDGGLDLSGYLKTIQTKTAEDIERFLIEAHRLVLGIYVLGMKGVIHHDLKPQNIVYNEAKNRINFIDFGFMTRYKFLKSESIDSINTHAIEHWSFPLEMMFLNNNEYTKYATMTPEERQILFPELWENIRKHVKLLISYTNYKMKTKMARETYETLQRDYYDMFVNDLTPEYYNAFLEKSLKTIDVYGLGMTFLYVLGSFKHLIGDAMFSRLHRLSMLAISASVKSRCDTAYFLKSYEDILSDSGLLTKYGLRIHDHTIIESTNTNQLCSIGKERNPYTNRCVNICKDGYIRSKNFKCTRKHTVCPENTVINPTTNRCVSKCKTGYVRNKTFRCTAKSTMI